MGVWVVHKESYMVSKHDYISSKDLPMHGYWMAHKRSTVASIGTICFFPVVAGDNLKVIIMNDNSRDVHFSL